MATASSSTCWRGKHSVDALCAQYILPVDLTTVPAPSSALVHGCGQCWRSLQRQRFVVLGCDFLRAFMAFFPFSLRLTWFVRGCVALAFSKGSAACGNSTTCMPEYAW